MSDRDEEKRREVVVNDMVRSMLPKGGSASAYAVALAIRELIQPIVDRSIGSGAGMGVSDIQVEISGVQYVIEVRPVNQPTNAEDMVLGFGLSEPFSGTLETVDEEWFRKRGIPLPRAAGTKDNTTTKT